jgi:hypothetical protein
MFVYGQLKNAQIENKSSDYSAGVVGRIWLNTTSILAKYDSGSGIKTIVDTDSLQILSNKTFDVYKMSYQTTPATPSAGLVSVYVKSNDKVYIKKSSGVESVLGSGAGASSLIWEKNGLLSPSSETIDGFRLEAFSNLDTQEVYALLTVPEGYEAGTQLKLLYGSFFTTVTSGNILFRAQTALIRDAVTVLGTYSNIHTSTNAEVSAAAVSNTLKAIGEIDITNASGQINGVAIAAGDKLRVRLYRDIASETSSAASDARLLINNFQLRTTI